jgi:hypothetical protein
MMLLACRKLQRFASSIVSPLPLSMLAHLGLYARYADMFSDKDVGHTVDGGTGEARLDHTVCGNRTRGVKGLTWTLLISSSVNSRCRNCR